MSNNILKEIQAETRTLEFNLPVNESLPKKVLFAYPSPQLPGLFMVKMSIARIQYVLGYFSTLVDAARFADMASLFFRTYRRNAPAYNFNQAQASFDLNNEPQARNLIERIFSCLNSAGRLGEFEKQSAAPAPSNPVKTNMQNVIEKLDIIWAVQQKEIKCVDELSQRNIETQQKLEGIFSALDRIACRFDRIEARLEHAPGHKTDAAVDIAKAKLWPIVPDYENKKEKS